MNAVRYPAIDLRGGAVVRLRQGDFARETRYVASPLALARRYAAAGARWLHLVDLDAAREGGPTLAPLLRALADTTPLRVQVGGGVRGRADVESLLAAGAARVVVGSHAVRAPDDVIAWLDDLGPERIVVALDTRRDATGRWTLPGDGWTAEGGVADLFALAARFAASGLRHLLCTDIARDGMLSGPNVALYRALAVANPTLAIQASGGVRDTADVDAVAAAGCDGVVLGRALLDGTLPLSVLAPPEVAC
jgi:phosphoribosylformimino-5-aminoimidazole carboxamide ribotide isomerase